MGGRRLSQIPSRGEGRLARRACWGGGPRDGFSGPELTWTEGLGDRFVVGAYDCWDVREI
eukprot:1634478-Alexandrium_andersonii.AAC.1